MAEPDLYWDASSPNAPELPALDYVKRTVFLPAFVAFPVVFSGMSYLAGGVQFLTDLSMVSLSVICAVFLLNEFRLFPKRFGVGGIIFFGGILNWFCLDYLTNWLNADFRNPAIPYPPATVAKAAFFITLFVAMMSLGFNSNFGRKFEKIFAFVPEPANGSLLFVLGLCGVALGLVPYAFFTQHAFPVAVWREISGQSVYWTVGRTGSLNYSWGGYVAQLLDVGSVAAILLAVHAVLHRPGLFRAIICWMAWAFFSIYSFNTGRRGILLAMIIPVAAIVFIKYQSLKSMRGGQWSFRAFLYGGIFIAILFVFIQIQTQFRGRHLRSVDIGDVQMTKIAGNTMFSEALDGWHTIPDQRPFFFNSFPGEGLIRCLPETFFRFVIHPIPRALWTNKPIDPAWAWRAEASSSGAALQGTTTSTSLVGWFYFRFGAAGVLQGGLLIGWLMRRAECALQYADGRTMVMLFSLAFSGYLFRAYRDLTFLELYTIIIGAIPIWILVKLSGASSRSNQPMPATQYA